jgi:hypothetical protein
MSTPYPRLSAPGGVKHPVVLKRRIRDVLLLGATALVPTGIALLIAFEVSNPDLVVAVMLAVGAIGLVTLLVSSRLELTVGLLALYLGLLDGPVKNGIGGGHAVSAVRDVLIITLSVGALVRLLTKRDRIKLPPLSAWVLAFVALVLLEAFNPRTHGFHAILGGFRQQLEWVPFFFFGYAIIRSKARFRALFVLLGVIAVANAFTATYQTRLSPEQVASWGPGYEQKIQGGAAVGGGRLGARTYSREGEGHVRPFGLGSDAGFGGGVGVIALPGTLALLAIVSARRRWLALLLCLAAIVSVATGLGRLQLVGALIAVGGFVLLSLSAGRRVTRPLAALFVGGAVAIPFGMWFVSIERSGTFARYESIEPSKTASTTTSYKTKLLGLIPKQIAIAPFGVGLGSVGPAKGFGETTRAEKAGLGATAETQYNFVTDELGAPGLALYVGFISTLILLAMRRLPRLRDVELRIALAGVFAPLIAMFFMGFSGPLMTSAALGPYFWFAAGVGAYWFLGPGRALDRATPPVMTGAARKIV